ncbi:MAG: hypothetical protein JNL70_16545 [Saprospiraceae bacterium]|nr:hypothetical protein [Saprospiraceae bacterium]
MRHILLCLLLSANLPLSAQVLTGFSARYNNSFVDWDIYVDSLDNSAGNLTMTWQNPDDWTQWSYRMGDISGNIKTKWQKDLTQWETRGSNKTISAQMMWSNDPREWRVTDNKFSLEIKCRFGNNWNEWIVDDSKRGFFRVITRYENDPRDWLIEDELDPSVSFPMKMTLLYLVMFNSVPKQ